MRIPLKWLAEYVDVTLPPEALGQRLTLAGLECAAIEPFPSGRSDWTNVFVARVVEVAPHPNADRLRLATVDLGAQGRLTVVCGAPNIAAGQNVAFARVGARVLDHDGQPSVLKAAKIRGVESAGMVCSERELGLSGEHEGILVLPAAAPVGTPLAGYLGDTVLDLEITANRPDCLSVLGVAREVAALTGHDVREPAAGYPESAAPVTRLASAAVEAPELCPRYCAAVISGVKVGPSPAWLQERLSAAGMRPINNVVDVTNYVMLEYGEPLHAFDLHKLAERRIVVRRAHPGESLVTIDNQRRALSPDMLVIADAQRPLAVAGVMGGAESEVGATTADLLLEAACFNRSSIRRTSRALALRSEASLRFEKGLSAELPVHALRRACRLLHEVCGGAVAQGIIDVYPGAAPSPLGRGQGEGSASLARPEPVEGRAPGGETILLERRQIARILGTTLPDDQVERTLRALGFRIALATGGWQIGVPYWRTDISTYYDLIEELARIVGYDVAPTAPLSGALPVYQPQPLLELKERVRDALAAAGLQEIITYSLVSRALLEKGLAWPSPAAPPAGALSVIPSGTRNPSLSSPPEGERQSTALRAFNPMSPEQEYLRTALAPSVLSTLAANEDRGERGQALFEVGRVYLPRPHDQPEERELLVAALAGPWQPTSWLSKERTSDFSDFYDAKGVLEALLSSLNLDHVFAPLDTPVIPSAAKIPSLSSPAASPASVPSVIPSAARNPSPSSPLEGKDKDVGEGMSQTARPERVEGRAPTIAALLAPARAARVLVGDAPIGVVGEVRPDILRAFDVSEPVVALFQLDLQALLPLVERAARRYAPISRYPPVARDLAIVVDAGVRSAQVEAIVRGQPLVVSVAPFDVYGGEGIPPGKLSLAYHIVYQSRDHTLTDQEVERAQGGILRRLERELGATLRG